MILNEVRRKRDVFLKQKPNKDKYTKCDKKAPNMSVDDPEYVNMPTNATKFPSYDANEKSLIQTLWLYQNADAS